MTSRSLVAAVGATAFVAGPAGELGVSTPSVQAALFARLRSVA